MTRQPVVRTRRGRRHRTLRLGRRSPCGTASGPADRGRRFGPRSGPSGSSCGTRSSFLLGDPGSSCALSPRGAGHGAGQSWDPADKGVKSWTGASPQPPSLGRPPGSPLSVGHEGLVSAYRNAPLSVESGFAKLHRAGDCTDRERRRVRPRRDVSRSCTALSEGNRWHRGQWPARGLAGRGLWRHRRTARSCRAGPAAAGR